MARGSRLPVSGPRLIHDDIARVLKRWVLETDAAPGASAFLAAACGGSWRMASGAVGHYSREERLVTTTATVYDLASLTKPVVAATVARLVRRGLIRWEAALGRLLPAARGTPSEAAPLSLLLAHRAGLMAHRRLRNELPAGDVAAWLTLSAESRRPECSGAIPGGGFEPVYSDLGYILVGAALAASSGEELEALVLREVAAPLGLQLGSAATWSGRLGAEAFVARAAPTEHVPERGGLIRGHVHDDNAWDLAGSGIAGHAGLFGTAEDVGRFAVAIVDALAGRSQWLAAGEAELLVCPRPGGSLLAGFDGKAESGSSAGTRFGPKAFGHLGFTGTSVWCDPQARIVVVLLTNRVCPSRENIVLRSVRPSVHDALFGLAADLVS